MRKPYFFILPIILLIGCDQPETENKIPNNAQKEESDPLDDSIKYDESNEYKGDALSKYHGLQSYLSQFEIKADTLIEKSGNENEMVEIKGNRFQWLDREKRTCRINGKFINLKDQLTINNVLDDNRDKFFSNTWNKIYLFHSNNYSLMGIEMHFDPCNGLGCSVSNFLIYDLNKKVFSLFGQFGIDDELKLYQFDKQKTSFLAFNYIGDVHGNGDVEYIFTRYDLHPNGFLAKSMINNQEEKITYYWTNEDSIIGNDSIRVNWFETIDVK